MKVTKYYLVYRHSLTSYFQMDDHFVILHPSTEYASPNHRTVVGPFDTEEQAKKYQSECETVEGHFVHMTSTELNLGDEVTSG